VLKKYQLGRTDLLINTDWGIPHDGLTKGDAQSRNMLLFHNRWVTKEEKKQLREEHSTYQSILITGYLLLCITLYIIIYIGNIFQTGIVSASITVIYGIAMLAAGIGLIKFRRFARNIAVLVFVSFLVLPFMPMLSDEKDAPLLIVLGLSGLYYLLRKTARKIFSPFFNENANETKNKSAIVRKVIYLIILCVALFTGYFAYDMIQARRMAADACIGATQGIPLEDFLSKFSEKDYRIIRRAEYLTIVPKRGMGRNHCTVSHDGLKITGSKTGYID
jgi:hypothetical protein